MEHRDCQQAPNTACFNGICTCIEGYKRITYFSEFDKEQLACIPKLGLT